MTAMRATERLWWCKGHDAAVTGRHDIPRETSYDDHFWIARMGFWRGAFVAQTQRDLLNRGVQE